jgi:hypothetical protein
VYRTLLDGEAVRQWMVPDGMTSQVHLFDAPELGSTMSMDKLAGLVETR